jgi:hypothetical protein
MDNPENLATQTKKKEKKRRKKRKKNQVCYAFLKP